MKLLIMESSPASLLDIAVTQNKPFFFDKYN